MFISDKVQPNFLIIGAAKAGTTSLYHYLRQHPQIFLPDNKEPHYFSFAERKYLEFGNKKYKLPKYSFDWYSYLKLFESADAKKSVAIGEASVSYLCSASAPHNIRKRLPNVKMIAVLRNPVERAFSHYLMGVRDQWAPATFAEALSLEDEEAATPRTNPVAFNHCYKRMGLYGDQIERYRSIFEKEQLRIYLYEDLLSNPTKLISDIFQYLGVDSMFCPDIRQRENAYANARFKWLRRIITHAPPTSAQRSLIRRTVPKTLRDKIRRYSMKSDVKPSINKREKEVLIDFFRRDVEKVETIIGRDLTHWLR